MQSFEVAELEIYARIMADLIHLMVETFEVIAPLRLPWNKMNRELMDLKSDVTSKYLSRLLRTSKEANFSSAWLVRLCANDGIVVILFLIES